MTVRGLHAAGDEAPKVRITRRLPGGDYGSVTCEVCGKMWPTTAAQDELLAAIFEHEHRRPPPGRGPSSAHPSISTR
jgi:hypothetical protein